MKKMLKKIVTAFLACSMMTCALPVCGAAEQKNIRITLDPGHGEGKSADGSTGTGTDAAVKFGGINELYYNLTISLYTRERLLQYAGVDVNMTRETNQECPGLQERVDIAKAYNSDAIISIHNNMNPKETAYGSQIYIPNRNYNSKMAVNSQRCANKIMSRLVSDAGMHKNCDPYYTDHESIKYPDGSAADHLRVIRFGKLAELEVAMIVECAFLSNESDYKEHIATDDGLKALGYAIAEGIADYYKLELKSTETEPITTQPTETEPVESKNDETKAPEDTETTTPDIAQTGSPESDEIATQPEQTEPVKNEDVTTVADTDTPTDPVSDTPSTDSDEKTSDKKAFPWWIPVAGIVAAAAVVATVVFFKKKKN